MQSQTRTLVIGVVAVAVAAVLFVVLQGGDDEDGDPAATTAVEEQAGGNGGSQDGGGSQKPDGPEVATIVVRDGQPVGGVLELEFAKGDRIRFAVESDTADEIHLHGYDVEKEVSAGGKVAFDVPATIEGVFEAELHHSLAPIAEITVTPG